LRCTPTIHVSSSIGSTFRAGSGFGAARSPHSADMDTRAAYLCHLAMATSKMTKPARCRWRPTSAQRRSSSETLDCDRRRSNTRGRTPCPFRLRASRPPCAVRSARAARASIPPRMTRFLLISGSKVRAIVLPPSIKQRLSPYCDTRKNPAVFAGVCIRVTRLPLDPHLDHAFEAIAATVPLGSVGYERAADDDGDMLIWLAPCGPRRKLQRRDLAPSRDRGPRRFRQ
jgi:hypothetical protein